MKEKIKKILLSVIVIIVLISIFSFSDTIWEFLSQKFSPKIVWRGFYYKNAEYPTTAFQESMMLNEAPTFDSLQDCMKWGSNMLVNSPLDGFECAYGCRFDEKYNATICKDTTKMIYLDRFEGQ